MAEESRVERGGRRRSGPGCTSGRWIHAASNIARITWNNGFVPVLLVSTYDLGRQPSGLASPAAWLRRAGVAVECVDVSRDRLQDDHVRAADLVAFYLPMHTATRLAGPLIEQVRTTNPRATVAAYGLYAPLNAAWLTERGVTHVLGAEAEGDLVALASGAKTRDSGLGIRDSGVGHSGSAEDPEARGPASESPVLVPRVPSPESRIPRLTFIQPDRSTLPSLRRYAALQMPDGSQRVVGNAEATRGCKHLCRHCPIVPVYRGTFRAVPLDVVMADVHAQIAAGAQHISFGDPDFFNGPTHARRLIERFAAECPGVTYDATIKVEHLLRHAGLLPLLRDTGCVFVTSAVESLDDVVLDKLRKGHTRDDVVRAVELCRAASVTLSPTFVPFTPWTSLAGYVTLLDDLEGFGIVDAVAPIQLAIRLLVTADSALLELPDVRELVEPFDADSLTWPWRHHDSRVDALQREVMALVASMPQAPRRDVFRAVSSLAHQRAGVPRTDRGAANDARVAAVPYLTEAWYCCAEPCAAQTSPPAPTAPLDYV
jgi:radical SAM superfamily enzyme YgiQ (UPF0313 family)